jgi:hypothetical protein
MRGSFTFAILAAAWLSSTTTSARAQEPKIVVLDFSGKGGDKARIQAIRALKDRASFAQKDEAEKVLVRNALSATTVDGRAAVAEELRLDYVFWGTVRGKGSSARAKISVAGPKGRTIASRQAGPPGTSAGNTRIQKATRALLAKAIATVPPQAAEEPEGEPAQEPESVVPVTPPVEQAPAAESVVELEKPVAIEVEAPTPFAPYVTLLGGVGGRTRTLEVNIDDGSGGTATRKYESGVYLDIVFRLEVRPLAKFRTPGPRGLALEADADFGVGLETETPSSTERLDTKAWRVLGQLGYFHRFAKGELGGLVGIGFDRLQFPPNGFLPSVDYLYLRVGPAYRHFFLDRLLHLRVDAGFRYPFSYGDLESTFGDAKGVGFDVGLMLGGELDIGFAYAARVSLDYFRPKFSGFPEGTVPPDPPAAQGRDATDLAINFHIMVGWAF